MPTQEPYEQRDAQRARDTEAALARAEEQRREAEGADTSAQRGGTGDGESADRSKSGRSTGQESGTAR